MQTNNGEALRRHRDRNWRDGLGRLSEAMRLSELVYDALPAGHAVWRAFEALDAEYEAAEPGELRPATVRAALDAFYGLTDGEQRRILNGWRAAPDRPGRQAIREELVDPEADVEVRRVPVVLGPSAGPATREPEAYQEYVLDEREATVKVTVVEGTARDVAIRHLLAIASRLADIWDELVDEVPPAR